MAGEKKRSSDDRELRIAEPAPMLALFATAAVASSLHGAPRRVQPQLPPPLNGLALTPPMTWSSWGSFGCLINETHMLATADAFVKLGLVKAGYNTLQIDDCWSVKVDLPNNVTGRDPATGELLPNATKWPRGLRFIADYLRARGLHLGIYTDIGQHTCAGYPGSYGHYCQDAATFSSWGITYVKQDFCGPRPVTNCGHPTLLGGEGCYSNMSKCLLAQSPKIVYGLCSWGSDAPWTYGRKIGANLWRTSADMQHCWESVMRTVDNQIVALDAAGPGGWNDMDELFLGTYANGMSLDERQTMFNFFVIFASPLSSGDNVLLPSFDANVSRMYTNVEVIQCYPPTV